MRPLWIVGSGMVTSVGLDAPSTCAAIRCGISGARETAFVDEGGDPILGCSIPEAPARRGLERLVWMASGAIGECLRASGRKPEEIPLLLCAAEEDRPGRFDDLDDRLVSGVQDALKARFHPLSRVIPRGRVAIAQALRAAEAILHDKKAPCCLIAGADSYLTAAALAHFEESHRLLTGPNSNGFIPGEAASALLVVPPSSSPAPRLVCRGVATSREKAVRGGPDPLRADGLLEAWRAVLRDAGTTEDEIDYRIADVNGEQRAFREASLAVTRAMTKVKRQFPLSTPMDCIGETGAAAGPSLLSYVWTSSRKGYAPGPRALCHVGNDDGERAALVLEYQEGGDRV